MMFLERLRVLDLSRVLAGPLAGQLLGDMGAEVLKVESSKGDDTRSWGPPFQKDMSAYFQSCNRNKASLVLDLKSPAGQKQLQQLLNAADVVLDNFPNRVRHRLGLDPETLSKEHPHLVICGIQGYTGSRSDEPGYDVMIQAEAGWMGVSGEAEGEPSKVGMALVDVVTGLLAANGVLAALFRRERTGQGAVIDISLFQSALFSLVNVATNALVSGQPSKRWGNAHPNIVPYQAFRCRDGQIVIGAGNDAQFKRLCEVLGIFDPVWLQSDNAMRVAHRDELLNILQPKLENWDLQPLLQLLRQKQVSCAPILRPDEALLMARQFDDQAILALPHAQFGSIETIAPPIRGQGMRTNHQPPPNLNEGGQERARSWLNTRRG
jgi:crotonobetainyl-CoA:carnitine CoA-transferase CaiB-like acyl-CoA transferase